MKLRALLFAGLCVVAGQVQAGLFSDEEAHIKIRQLEASVSKLEGKLQETSKQQTQAMLDLQSQIELQNTELRKLRGQNEELIHNLQNAERRQKDFYVDLDTRMRHFETIAATVPTVPIVPTIAPPSPQPAKAADAPPHEDGPALENRAYEAAYGLFKAGSHQQAISAFQEFLKKFPESVHIPHVHYQMGGAYFALKNYKSALDSYQLLIRKYSYSPSVPDAMFGAADCQQALGNKAEAKKTLDKIIAKYPGSEMADKARKRLKTIK